MHHLLTTNDAFCAAPPCPAEPANCPPGLCYDPATRSKFWGFASAAMSWDRITTDDKDHHVNLYDLCKPHDQGGGYTFKMVTRLDTGNGTFTETQFAGCGVRRRGPPKGGASREGGGGEAVGGGAVSGVV